MKNTLITILALFGVLSAPLVAHAKEKRPNILFIMSDDHACNAISSYGGRLAEVAPKNGDCRGRSPGLRISAGSPSQKPPGFTDPQNIGAP